MEAINPLKSLSQLEGCNLRQYNAETREDGSTEIAERAVKFGRIRNGAKLRLEV